jgi:hypothetical protein
VEQGGQAYEILDARRIAHSLEYGRARETHSDRVPTAKVKVGIMNMGSVGVQENRGSIGAMREREYFEGPQLPINAFPCQIEPVLFAKVRVAQSCR